MEFVPWTARLPDEFDLLNPRCFFSSELSANFNEVYPATREKFDGLQTSHFPCERTTSLFQSTASKRRSNRRRDAGRERRRNDEERDEDEGKKVTEEGKETERVGVTINLLRLRSSNWKIVDSLEGSRYPRGKRGKEETTSGRYKKRGNVN